MLAHMSVRLPRTVLRLAGQDAFGFLQNLVTNDLARLERDPVIYAGLLSPQGKVVADFFLWRSDEAILLEADATRGPDLAERLGRYRLRAQVEISDLSSQIAVHAHFERPNAPIAAPDPRLAALGWRSLNDSPSAGDPHEYEERRIACGVPDLAKDTVPEEVFALEALFEELDGVDFAKGCFVGQENVSRMKRRATTRRKFARLSTLGCAKLGAPVLARGVEIGTVRAAAPGVAIALLRVDRALEAAELTADRPVRLDLPDWFIPPRRETG
jgi:folate-binding protein YgfZ